MKILVTGFEPFRDLQDSNASWEAVRLLPDRIGEAAVVKACLPVAFGRAEEAIQELLAGHQPDIYLAAGQSGRISALEFERIGVNVDCVPEGDNDGEIRVDTPIVAGGPDGFFSNLPVRAMMEASRAAGVPAVLSGTAGSHLCNHTLYYARHLGATQYPGLRSGFVHVPFAPGQCLTPAYGGKPMMPSDVAARGIAAALEAALRL